MEIWRLHKSKYRPNDASGAMILGGRYNSIGVPALYAGLSASASILELRVHLESLPDSEFQLSRARISKVKLLSFSTTDVLGWDDTDYGRTHSSGDIYLNDSGVCGFVVPSVTSRGNDPMVVLNPTHPEFSSLKWTTFHFEFDMRLWREN